MTTTHPSSNIVPLHHADQASIAIAYGHHGTVQVFVGCERDYSALRDGFERVLSYRPRHNFMLNKLTKSADYTAQYVDCGPIGGTAPPPAGGLFDPDARQQRDLFD